MPSKYVDVEIFATGHHHGRDWTDADLTQALANWQQLRVIKNADGKPLLDPPLWLGHEELPDLASQTDLPRFGDVNGLALKRRSDGQTAILASFNDVHPELAEWIDSGKIKDISAEFYPDWVDEKGKHWGIVLRRVSCLGGTPPAVMSLNTFNDKRRPAIAFGDGKQPIITVKLPFKFADSGGSAMDTKQMIEMIKGLDPKMTDDFLALLDDKMLTALLASLAPKPEDAKPVDPPAPVAGQMGDKPPVAGATPPGAPASVTFKYDDAAKKTAELEGRQRAIVAQISTSEQLAAARLTAEKTQTVESFCDRMVKAGKLLPAQVDHSDDPQTKRRVNPANVFDRLLRADAVNRVHKFSDKPPMSELELQMAEIESGPVVLKFGDRMADPVKAGKYTAAREQVKQQVAAREAGRGKSLERRMGMLPARSAS